MRDWRSRYEIEIVGMCRHSFDVHVTRRPADRNEALALAREQYLYCLESIFNRCSGLRPLAIGLMAHDWWNFFWESFYEV